MAAKRRKIVEEDFDLGHGSTTIPTDSGGTRAANKFGIHTLIGAFNVKDFGAIGDGTTDDTAAIQATLDAAVSSSNYGQWVIVPLGTYKITSTLTVTTVAGLRITGASKGRSILQSTSALANLPLLKFLDGRDCTVEHLRINGVNGSALNSCITFHNTSASSAFAPARNTVRDCFFGADTSANIKVGIRFTCDGGADTNNAENLIENNYIANYNESGVSIEHSNSLNNLIKGGSITSGSNGVSAVKIVSGGFRMEGTSIGLTGTSCIDFDFTSFTGIAYHPYSIANVVSESNSAIVKTTTTSGLTIAFVNYHKVGSTAGDTVVDFQAASSVLRFVNCNLNFGQVVSLSSTDSDSEIAFIGTNPGFSTYVWEGRLAFIEGRDIAGTPAFTPGGSATLIRVGWKSSTYAINQIYAYPNLEFLGTLATLPLATITALTVSTIAVGGDAAQNHLLAGTYTPTLTNVANVASSTAHLCSYMQIGKVITVSGYVSVTPTASGNVATEIDLSVPILNSLNIDAMGGNADSGNSGILGITGFAIQFGNGNKARFQAAQVTTTAASDYAFTFTYHVS